MMATPSKRLIWASVIATPLFAATVACVVYVYGLPPVITSLLNRSVTEPASEEYAAYSAFVDDFFLSDRPFQIDRRVIQGSVVCIVGETEQMRSPGSILPLDVATLGPNEMGEDFFRQNAQTWRLHPNFHTRLRVSLVDSDAAGAIPDNPQVCGVLQLSRAGFNRRGTLALLYYSYRCGLLCGQSGWVVLQKTQGIWRIKEFGSGRIL